MAGACTMSQLQKVFEVTGNPADEIIASWQSPFAQTMLLNAKAKRRLRLSELCPNLPRDAKHLMKSLFRLDPNERITAEATLEHDYLAEFHNPDTEPSYPHGPIDIGINDNTKLSADQYKMKLYDKIGEGSIDERMTSADASVGLKQPRKVTIDGNAAR